MDPKNILTYQIDRSLNSTDNQQELFVALSILQASFGSLHSELNVFLPKLTKLFQETPFPFIQLKIVSIFAIFAQLKEDSLINCKQQLINAFNQMTNSPDPFERKLTLTIIGLMSSLFNESLSTYHILLAKTLSPQCTQGAWLEVLTKLVSQSKHLSCIFTRNFKDIMDSNLPIALQILGHCDISHLQKTKMLLLAIEKLESLSQVGETVTTSIVKLILREIPFSPHLAQFVSSHPFTLGLKQSQRNRILKRVSTFHPYLSAELPPVPTNLLGQFFEHKRGNPSIHLNPQALQLIVGRTRLGECSLDDLLLSYYCKYNHDGRLLLLRVDQFLEKHLKVLMTLRYPETATKLIEYMFNCQLTTKQYKRLVFYHAISKNYQGFKNMACLLGLSRYRGHMTFEHLYTKYILECYGLINNIYNKAEVVERINSVNQTLKRIEEGFPRVRLDLAKNSLIVLEQMACRSVLGEKHPIQSYQNILGPWVPSHLLVHTLDGIIACILYFPKSVYLHPK